VPRVFRGAAPAWLLAPGLQDALGHIQDFHGKAKPYQVKQVLAAIDKLEKEDEES
jgi:hypothetical protein